MIFFTKLTKRPTEWKESRSEPERKSNILILSYLRSATRNNSANIRIDQIYRTLWTLNANFSIRWDFNPTGINRIIAEFPNSVSIIVNEQPRPSATAIFVGGASLLHLRLKFSVTITFTIMETEFGNSAYVFRNPDFTEQVSLCLKLATTYTLYNR